MANQLNHLKVAYNGDFAAGSPRMNASKAKDAI